LDELPKPQNVLLCVFSLEGLDCCVLTAASWGYAATRWSGTHCCRITQRGNIVFTISTEMG